MGHPQETAARGLRFRCKARRSEGQPRGRWGRSGLNRRPTEYQRSRRCRSGAVLGRFVLSWWWSSDARNGRFSNWCATHVPRALGWCPEPPTYGVPVSRAAARNSRALFVLGGCRLVVVVRDPETIVLSCSVSCPARVRSTCLVAFPYRGRACAAPLARQANCPPQLRADRQRDPTVRQPARRRGRRLLTRPRKPTLGAAWGSNARPR